MTRHRRTVLPLSQRTYVRRQDFREHRNDAVGKVDRISALASLAVERTARTNVVGHIRNRHDRIEATITVRLGPDRIVMVARICRVDGHDRQMAQVFTIVFRNWQFRCQLCFVQRFLRENVGDAVLGNCDQAEAARGQRIAEHLDNVHAAARTLARRLDHHELAFLGPAQILDRAGAADFLVDRGEPWLAAAVDLHHAHHAVHARRQFLHDMSAVSPTRFFGAGENTVAHSQGSALALVLKHADSGWRRSIVG